MELSFQFFDKQLEVLGAISRAAHVGEHGAQHDVPSHVAFGVVEAVY